MITSEFIQGEITIPTPLMEEHDRLGKINKERLALQAQGLMIISERRVHNPVFDKKGEKTTFKFLVKPYK